MDEGSISDIVIMAFILSGVQGLAGMVIDNLRGRDEHPLQDVLVATANMLQDQLEELRAAIEERKSGD